MNSEAIEIFAKEIVKNVRDRAISNCDVQLYTENLNSPIAARWNEVKKKDEPNLFAEMVISDVVDSVIFCLFNALDEGTFRLYIKDKNDKLIDLTNEGFGELGGWYMGEWRSKFTKQRCFNDLLEG